MLDWTSKNQYIINEPVGMNSPIIEIDKNKTLVHVIMRASNICEHVLPFPVLSSSCTLLSSVFPDLVVTLFIDVGIEAQIW